MIDIEQLRADLLDDFKELLQRAMCRITELEAERDALHEQNRKLRDALTKIANAPSEMTWGEDTEVAECLNKCEAIADAALAEGETE